MRMRIPLKPFVCLMFAIPGTITQFAPQGPSLNSPDCIKVPEARAELPGDEILGVGRNGEYCAYPLRMMAYHRVVNDHLGGPPILVAYDPDAGMGQVYDPVINKKEYNFDSAGLRGGAPTLKDRETSSVWSLATGEAIEGSLKGTRMTRIPSWIITWKRFSELHPDAYVLKEDAQQSPHYVTRSTAPTCPLPGAMKQSTTGRIDKRLPVDTLIFGVSGSDGPTALALAALTKSKGVVYDKGTVIFYDENGKAAGAYVPKAKGKQLRFTVMDKDGARIFRDAETQSTWTIEGSAIDGPLKGEILTSVSSCRSRWFAWSAAFPKTEIVRKAK